MVCGSTVRHVTGHSWRNSASNRRPITGTVASYSSCLHDLGGNLMQRFPVGGHVHWRLTGRRLAWLPVPPLVSVLVRPLRRTARLRVGRLGAGRLGAGLLAVLLLANFTALPE